jgi:histidinol dehydrogenase
MVLSDAGSQIARIEGLQAHQRSIDIRQAYNKYLSMAVINKS